MLKRYVAPGPSAAAEGVRFDPHHERCRQYQEHRTGDHGKAEEAIGKLADDDEKVAQGNADQAAAKLKNAGDDLRDAFKKQRTDPQVRGAAHPRR